MDTPENGSLHLAITMTLLKNFRKALLFVSFFYSHALQAAEAPPQTLQELTAALETVLMETNTPGMAVALVTRDEVLYAGGLGLADVGNQIPATGDTLFRIGSTTKTFVSLSALKLQAEGKLDLDDTLAALAPEIAFRNRWEETNPVRLVHLLEHTTGFDDIHFRDYANTDARPGNLQEVLAYDPDSRSSRWPPGTHMSYTNSGPAVAAYVIGKVAGMPFEDYVQQNWFAPLGMQSSTFFEPAQDQPAALLYQRDAVTPYAYWNIAMRPSGAVNSSANDMAKYVQMFLRRGEVNGVQLISATALQRMESPESWIGARAGLTVGYGLSNYTTTDDKGFIWHGHNGGVQGGAADMSYNLDAGVGYAVMVNAANGPAVPRAMTLIRNFLTRETPAATLPPTVAIPPEIQQQFGGYYVLASPRVQRAAALQRITTVLKLQFNDDGSANLGGAFGGGRQHLVGVTERTLREDNDSVASVALLAEPVLGDTLIAAGTSSFRKISAPAALGPMLLLLGALLNGVITVVFAAIWGLRYQFGDLDIDSTRPQRLWPLYSTLTLFGFLLMLVMMQSDAFLLEHYSVLNFRSGMLALFSVLMVLIPLLAAWKVARSNRAIHAGIYLLAAFTVITQSGLALCLAWFGMVPFVTWT